MSMLVLLEIIQRLLVMLEENLQLALKEIISCQTSILPYIVPQY